MERVIKRFLLHNNRENEDVRESDFDELKQDVQMVRFEMLNCLRQNKENAARNTSILHNGLSILGDFVCQSMQDSDLAAGFRKFQEFDKSLDNELDDYSDLNKQVTSFSRGFVFNNKEENMLKSIRKRSTYLSLKFEENVKIINPEIEELNSNKRLDNESPNYIKEKDTKDFNSFLDLNAINEEN